MTLHLKTLHRGRILQVGQRLRSAGLVDVWRGAQRPRYQSAAATAAAAGEMAAADDKAAPEDAEKENVRGLGHAFLYLSIYLKCRECQREGHAPACGGGGGATRRSQALAQAEGARQAHGGACRVSCSECCSLRPIACSARRAVSPHRRRVPRAGRATRQVERRGVQCGVPLSRKRGRCGMLRGSIDRQIDR